MKKSLKLFSVLMIVLLLLSGCASGSEKSVSKKTLKEIKAQDYVVSEVTGDNDIKNETSTPVSNEAKTDSTEDTTVKNHGDVIKFPVTNNKYTESQFLPSVAYMAGGYAQNYMFTGFAFTPLTNFVYHYGKEDYGMNRLAKNQWQVYVDSMFAEGYNVDALDNTVRQVKEAFDDNDYQVDVYGALLYPVKSVTSFGVVNGKNLDFSKTEDRIEGMKWLADEIIRRFNAKNYKNCRFAGFYYHIECIYEEEEETQILNAVTDYVRSKGYKTVWAPYYNANGYQRWKNYGFDEATTQINYFPGAESLPNAGGIDRISTAANRSQLYDIGIEMELCCSASNPNFKKAVGGFKEYMKAGVQTGYMYKFHTYWIQDTFQTVRALQKSNDPYLRSAYDELYKFINEELTVSDMTF